MTDTPKWPAYPIGPRDSIFALGVASGKFTELESILHFIFSTVFDFDAENDTAVMISSKIGVEPTVDLIMRRLPKTGWKAGIQDLVSHFLKGFGVCFANRNQLMHSNFAWGEETVLFTTTKKGNVHAAKPTLPELHRVADDMHAYVVFGRQLANAINNEKFGIPIFPAAAFPWPDTPPPPQRLHYSPDPQD